MDPKGQPGTSKSSEHAKIEGMFASQGKTTDDKLKQLEKDLEELRVNYEQYFAGINKIQPIPEHDRYKKALLNFQVAELKSTSMKFRFTNLKARYNQLNTLWEKICRQIEEGTYVRDMALRKLKSSSPASIGTSGLSAATVSGVDEKEKKAIGKLYEALKKASKNKKLMTQEKFINTMEKQLETFKSRNPGRSFQLKLAKDSKGSLQVKIEPKKQK